MPRSLPLHHAALLVALTASSALGQSKTDFSTVRFRPAVGPGNYLGLYGAEVAARGVASYALAFDYATDTLVVDHTCRGLDNLARCEDRSLAFVERTGLGHLLFAVGVGGRTQLSLGLPLGASDTKPFGYWVAQPGMASAYRELRPKNGFVIGDLRLAAKTSLYESASGLLHATAFVFATAPTGLLTSGGNCATGEHCTFMGERGLQAGGAGIVELRPTAGLRMAAHLGALYRPRRTWLDAHTGSELSYGAAASYHVAPRLALKAELEGALELASASDVPLEARGGVSYGRDWLITLGGGAGIVGRVGSPQVRLFGALQWTPVLRDADGDGFEDDDDPCPTAAEDRDGFEDGDGCPDPDNDGDGVADVRDACPLAAEDRDGFEDDDGCPDPDNDGDGVPDGYDTCEGEREDYDGDHDQDGCPDLDTDRDGVLDEVDRCPDEPEDTDGLADDDGCPEADFDQDGFEDEQDACPELPGVQTGAPGEDGCPS